MCCLKNKPTYNKKNECQYFKYRQKDIGLLSHELGEVANASNSENLFN